MVKKNFIYFSAVAVVCFLASCISKPTKPQLNLPVETVQVDTIISFNKDAACKIHINYAFLKGKEYAVTNDSLLRMGTLQPNYFAASYEKLTPQIVIPEIARRYGKEYLELARWLKDRERDASQLNWELSIDTKILPGTEKSAIYVSNIMIKTGETVNKYVQCFNIDPKTGKQTTLKDAFGDDYKEKLVKEIVEQMAKDNDWDDDNIEEAQRKGYFVGIAPYASPNFMLYSDSVTFVYNAGEISQKEVKVTIDN